MLYYTSNFDAFMQVKSENALRTGAKSIQLLPNNSNFGKVSWKVRQSGRNGPLVLQVIS